jgi:hypothetical protein
MKTLVIHPSDPSTDFLSKIYEGKNWTIINSSIGKRLIRKAIEEHDRIIMMGHGCEKGLFDGKYNGIITSDYVYLLRQKQCVAIWCNADVFFLKYGLKGLYTGMIISEYMEANLYCINTNYQEIDESNFLFSKAIKESIEITDSTILDKINSIYISENLNRTIEFNEKNIYFI